MNWIDAKKQLPIDGQAVLVRRADDNWKVNHTLYGTSQQQHIWRWCAVRFTKTQTIEDVKNQGVQKLGCQSGNNHHPYIWVEFGSSYLNSQDVTHWAAITDPLLGELHE